MSTEAYGNDIKKETSQFEFWKVICGRSQKSLPQGFNTEAASGGIL